MIRYYRIERFCNWFIVIDVTVILDIGNHLEQKKINISENLYLCKGSIPIFHMKAEAHYPKGGVFISYLRQLTVSINHFCYNSQNLSRTDNF
jgi:hypothetical protein